MKRLYTSICTLALVIGVAGCKDENEPVADYQCSDISNVKDKAVQNKLKDECGIGSGEFEPSEDKG
ncbi:entry exclusion lipoprotein TrbK [Pseudomonas sp. LTJR-52]|uniref:entry exclusion lipoprotein TrbK n=1 Tax=Pseudomonas sp. LTJR-52 TaxID=2479392 RepID=UPI000EFA997C|nr:entry exclusion lipoprotein TrbK [Pseudomonas sp. LTJR-52]